MTNAPAQNIAIAAGLRATPGTNASPIAALAASIAGPSRQRRALLALARRQAITGPRPESKTSMIASGTV